MCGSEDDQQWRDAIEKIVRDPKLGRALAENAFYHLRQSYTWEIRAKKILDFFLTKKYPVT
jgi:glycosyltransferase involved in cell wall biosynthesis